MVEERRGIGEERNPNAQREPLNSPSLSAPKLLTVSLAFLGSIDLLSPSDPPREGRSDPQRGVHLGISLKVLSRDLAALSITDEVRFQPLKKSRVRTIFLCVGTDSTRSGATEQGGSTGPLPCLRCSQLIDRAWLEGGWCIGCRQEYGELRRYRQAEIIHRDTTARNTEKMRDGSHPLIHRAKVRSGTRGRFRRT